MKRPLCFRGKVITQTPQCECPILSRMAESGTTEIENARQHAAVRQTILQAGVSIVKRVIGAKAA